MLEFVIFVETKSVDGYWSELSLEPGYLDGYYKPYDGYIGEELFIALSNIKDGYFAPLFKRDMPKDLSETVRYKLNMYSCLGTTKNYFLQIEEINGFNWEQMIYGSFLTTPTTFSQVSSDFMTYYVPALNALAQQGDVRIIILKK